MNDDGQLLLHRPFPRSTNVSRALILPPPPERSPTFRSFMPIYIVASSRVCVYACSSCAHVFTC